MTLNECIEAVSIIDDEVSKINIALTLEDPIDLVNNLIGELQNKVASLGLVEAE